MKKIYKKKTIILLSASLLLASNIAPVLATTINENSNVVPTEELDKTQTVTNSGEKESSANKLVTLEPKETTSSLNTSTPTTESKTVTNINPDQEEQKETPISTSDEAIDSWMPDKNLQKAVLDNLISQGILPETATLSDVTRGLFTDTDITLTFPTYSSFQSSGIQNLTGFETDGTLRLHKFLLGSYVEDIYSPQEVADSLNQLLIPASQYLEVTAFLANYRVTSAIDIKDVRVAYDAFWKHYQAGANVFLQDSAKNNNIVTTMVNLNQDNYKEFDVSLDVFKGVLEIVYPEDFPFEEPDEVPIEINGQEVYYELDINNNNAHFKMMEDLDFSIFNHHTSSPVDVGLDTVWSGVPRRNDSPLMGVVLNYNEIAKQAGDITVRYCDIEGKSISQNVVKTGNIGEDYTTEPKDIPGYTFKEIQGNASGKFTDQPQTVTYIYEQTKDQSTVIVHDSELTVGNTWNPEDNFDSATDYYGNTVPFSDIAVDGSVDTSKVGTYKVTYSRILPAFFSAENQGEYSAVATITVKDAQPVKGGDVTAKYIDTEGNKISDDVVKSGNVAENYSTKQKDIDGYTFKEVKGSPTGKFTDQPQTVTYVYTKNEISNVTGTILVKYVDTDGNKISEDIVKSGTVGEGYSTEKKNITGYTFKEIQGNAIGQFNDQHQIVTYIYTKDKNDTVNPEPKPENKSSSNGKNNNQGTISSTQHDLPATGESERMTMMSIILGLILIALGAVVSFFRFKKLNK